jgi:hypothetical protein
MINKKFMKEKIQEQVQMEVENLEILIETHVKRI